MRSAATAAAASVPVSQMVLNVNPAAAAAAAFQQQLLHTSLQYGDAVDAESAKTDLLG